MNLSLESETIRSTTSFSRHNGHASNGHVPAFLERKAAERHWMRDLLPVPKPGDDSGSLSAGHLSGDIWGHDYPRRWFSWLLGFFASLATGTFIGTVFAVSLPNAVELPEPGEYTRVTLIAPPAELLKSFYQKAPGKGGGGGGKATQKPPSQGRLPRFSDELLVSPSRIIAESPALPVLPTILANIPSQALDLSLIIGDPAGIPGPPSDGTGSPNGIGTGQGSGVGAGKGQGIWPGKDAGVASAPKVHRDSNGIIAPSIIREVPPHYTREAYDAGVEGEVVLEIVIGTDGRVSGIRVLKSLDPGLDEEARKTVTQWLFKPASKLGKPIELTARIPIYFSK